jgi:hypothetical protein
MRALFSAVFVLLFVVPIQPAFADSILISQTGTGTGSWSLAAVESNAVSWSALSASSNVTVSARLIGDFNGMAYLTTRIGTEATLADVLLSSSFSVASSSAFSWVDLFTDINLGPGTYYLVLGSVEDRGGGWANTEQPMVSTSSGITYNGSYTASASNNNLSFFPGSNFTDSGGVAVAPFQFQVSGDLKPKFVPEPTTLLLLVLSLTGLAALKLRTVPSVPRR